jgi:hypothetical protein
VSSKGVRQLVARDVLYLLLDVLPSDEYAVADAPIGLLQEPGWLDAHSPSLPELLCPSAGVLPLFAHLPVP